MARKRLNPCCCGRWSQRYNYIDEKGRKIVLILVVVEDGLRGKRTRDKRLEEEGLNPCCCGRWSQRFIIKTF